MEQGCSRATSGGSSGPVGLASASNAVSDTGGFLGSTRKLLLASSTNEEQDGSASKLKKEIERMQDRCARLGAMVARLAAAQQREQRGGDGDRDGEKGLEQLFEGQGEAEQQKQDVYFAAEEVRCTVTSLVVVALEGGVGSVFESPKQRPGQRWLRTKLFLVSTSCLSSSATRFWPVALISHCGPSASV